MNWRSTLNVLAVFLASVLTSACKLQQPSMDWNGTWKLNASKSSVQGQVITISIAADGEYSYDDGFVSTTFRCDGQYRPIGNNRTQACVRSSVTTLDRTRMENGVKTNSYHWELSSGGKVFKSTATAFRPSGPVILGQLVASRISGSNDFAGQWQDTSFLQRHPDLTLSLDNQYIHIGYPSGGDHIDAPLDGADAPMYGASAIAGMTYTVRRTGERVLVILGKRNGNPFTQESLELSDDGRVITDSWWNPARPTDKATLVYEKK